MASWLRARLKFFVVFGVVAVAAALLPSQITRLEQPQYCVRCHEVRAEYAAWAVSSHSRISCLECHGGQGFAATWNRRFWALTNAAKHVVGKVDLPLRARSTPGNQVCERCHTSSRPVTPSGDLIIPHERHSTSVGTPCAKCHVEVVHAAASRRVKAALAKTGGKLAEAVQIVEAEVQGLSPQERRPSMSTCVTCHDGKKAPAKCGACHRQIDIPANHRLQDWSSNHGRVARADIQGCLRCHAVVAGAVLPGERIALSQGVRNNPFCVACHTQRPVTHGARWKLLHKERARGDREGCLVCHNEEKQEGAAGGEVVACSACHADPHPKGKWRQEHPNVVKSRGAADCFACHDTASCSNCHTQGRLPLAG